MTFNESGQVAIGIPDAASWDGTYKLYVKDGIRTQKIKVDIGTGWADYVFDKNYKLKPLGEIETFIAENKHLEGIPTEKEIKENGLDLGETVAVQMEKIEELTLYLIDLKKENTGLKKRIEKLEKAVK